MTSWLLIRRLRGPAVLLLVGVTALLNQWDILSFGRSWPLYLILFGLFSLAERAALSQAQIDGFDPITGQPRTPDSTIYGGPGAPYGGPGTSIVPASSTSSTAAGPDSGTGRS
jgi:Domain of unknown function (DUF5668)